MELTKLRAAFGTPQPSGPVIDGLLVREFHLSVPADAPPGVTIVYVLTAAEQPVGVPETLVLASDEMPDPTACFQAVTAWATAALASKGRAPSDSATSVETVAPKVAEPKAEPGITLG